MFFYFSAAKDHNSVVFTDYSELWRYEPVSSQVDFSLSFESSICFGLMINLQTKCRICRKRKKLHCDNCGKGMCTQHKEIVTSRKFVFVNEHINYLFHFFVGLVNYLNVTF